MTIGLDQRVLLPEGSSRIGLIRELTVSLDAILFCLKKSDIRLREAQARKNEITSLGFARVGLCINK
jgi:hypothetical protein